MLTISILDAKPIPTGYPCIKRSSVSGKVVWFVNESDGFILGSDHGDELYFGKITGVENFKPWRGTITIRQD